MRRVSVIAAVFLVLVLLGILLLREQPPVAQITPQPTTITVAPSVTPTAQSTPTSVPTPALLTSTKVLTPNVGLLEVLTFAPNDSRLYYNDWEQIKSYAGMRDVNSHSSSQQREALLQAASSQHVLFAPFGMSTAATYGQLWSWDVTDAVWEATIRLSSDSLTGVDLVKFPQDYDLQPVIAHFKERGYLESSYRETTIYTHTADLSLSWVKPADPSIFNVAVLSDQQMLLFAENTADLYRVLDAYATPEQSLSANPAMHAVAQQMGTVGSAALRPGIDACSVYTSSRFDNQQLPKDKLQEFHTEYDPLLSQLHAYNALGLGYRYDEGRPLGLVVLHFPTADIAQADVATRQELGLKGIRVLPQQPDSTRWMTMESIILQQENIEFRLRMQGDTASRFLYSIARNDLPFAYCS